MTINLSPADIIALAAIEVESSADFDGLRNEEFFARGAMYALHASGAIDRKAYKEAMEHLARLAKCRRRELLGG